MGVSIPSSYSHNITHLPEIIIGEWPAVVVDHVGPVGPVTLAGIPTDYDVTIPTAYTVGITQLPKIQLDIDPLDVNVRIKEIPSVRVHVPSLHHIGFSLFGVELATIRLCGEAQVITEPYRPNPCEVCGTPSRLPGTIAQLEEG